MIAPAATGRSTASVTIKPSTTTEARMPGSTKGNATCAMPNAPPTSITPTKAAGQAHNARPPLSAAHRPTAIITAIWSMPLSGCAMPAAKDDTSWPGWAKAGLAPRARRAATENRRFMALVLSADRIVHGDELGAVGESGFDLDVVDHFGDAIHHLVAGEDVGALLHQLGDAFAVARAFQDEVADQRHRFRMVELDAAIEAAARHDRGHRNQQFVFFPRRQIHSFSKSTLL